VKLASLLVFSENLLQLAKLMFQQNSVTKYCYCGQYKQNR